MNSDSTPQEPDRNLLDDLPRLLDHLPLFAYVASLPDQAIVHANTRVVQLLGYGRDEVVAQGLRFFESSLHPSDTSAHRSSDYGQIGDDEILDRESRMRHRDGGWRWIWRREVVLDRHPDGTPRRILGIAEDVTERKLSERHLVRHHERLLQLLAYDIHDGLVQDIVGAQMALESVVECVSENALDCVQEVVLVRGLLRKAIGEGRRMITNLRPMIIDEMGVVEAIHYLVAEEESTQRLDVTFTHDVRFDRLAPMLEGVVFRIVQESLSNVRRHAGVTQAEVRLVQTNSTFLVEVEDRGVGFDPTRVKDHHFGLEGIRERARLFGGKATIRSAPGQGTLVSVRLPVKLSPEWDEGSAFAADS